MTDVLKLLAFLLGVGLAYKVYLSLKRKEGVVQDAEIIEKKAKIVELTHKAEESKQTYQDALKDWNDFANRPRNDHK